MKVSVVLVVHPKHQKYLPTALKSLKSQLTNHEVIVVDNKDYTLAKACNLGIEQSIGEYIVRLDADDWIEPELIQAESQYLDDHKEIDCVWCDYLKTSQSDHPQVFHVEHYLQPKLEHACGAMYRRKVWETLKYDEGLSYQEAFDFWCRFRIKGFKAHHMDIPMYYYRQHEGQMSKSPERQKVRKMLEKKYQGVN